MSVERKLSHRMSCTESQTNLPKELSLSETSENTSLNLQIAKHLASENLNASESSFAEDALRLSLTNLADVNSVAPAPAQTLSRENEEAAHLFRPDHIHKAQTQDGVPRDLRSEMSSAHVFLFQDESLLSNDEDPITDRTDTDLTHLKDLYNLLFDCFVGKEPSSDQVNICEPKLAIFERIINAKLQIKGLNNVFKVSEWKSQPQLLYQFLSNNSAKRLEEILKFVMNRFFKHLKKMFIRSEGLLYFDNKKFTECYFADTAAATSKPLDYYDVFRKLNDKPSFQQNYFKDLFASQKLRDAYQEWTANHFWKRYRQSIGKKLVRILFAWECKLKNPEKETRAVLLEMAESFKKVKMRSLPWTRQQVDSALDRLSRLIF
jgi:hypothetical protein